MSTVDHIEALKAKHASLEHAIDHIGGAQVDVAHGGESHEFVRYGVEVTFTRGVLDIGRVCAGIFHHYLHAAPGNARGRG